MVLMRRHGATVVGSSLRELVFRAIYSCDNARYLSEAKRLGSFSPLTPGEIEMAQTIYQLPNTQSRAWEYWERRLAKRGGVPAGPMDVLARLRERASERAGRPAKAAARKAAPRKAAPRKAAAKPVKPRRGKRK